MHALIGHVHTMQLIDGAELTHMRTAAASAAAVKVCIIQIERLSFNKKVFDSNVLH